MFVLLTTTANRRTLELQSTISSALAARLHTNLHPLSTISISLHVLSQDGSLRAALIILWAAAVALATGAVLRAGGLVSEPPALLGALAGALVALAPDVTNRRLRVRETADAEARLP